MYIYKVAPSFTFKVDMKWIFYSDMKVQEKLERKPLTVS